jgi:hypothetical protein
MTGVMADPRLTGRGTVFAVDALNARRRDRLQPR